MIRVKYAHQEGIRIGFNRFNQSNDEKIEDMSDTFVLAANDSHMQRAQSELVEYTENDF